jgi:hypothetical protein
MDYKDFFIDRWQKEAPAGAKSADESRKTAAKIELIQRRVRPVKLRGLVPWRSRRSSRGVWKTAPAPTSKCSLRRGVLL